MRSSSRTEQAVRPDGGRRRALVRGPGGQRVRLPRPQRRRARRRRCGSSSASRGATSGPGGGDRARQRRAGPRRLPPRADRARRARPRGPRGRAAATPTRRSTRAGLEAVADRRIGACSLRDAPAARAGRRAARPSRTSCCSTSPPRASTRTRCGPCARSCARTPTAGGTVLLSSHVLEEVAATCDRVVVVARGRRVAEGALDDAARPADPAALAGGRRAARRRCSDRGLDASAGRPGHGDRRRRRPGHGRPRGPRQRRGPARDEHAGRARGALRRPDGGLVTDANGSGRCGPSPPTGGRSRWRSRSAASWRSRSSACATSRRRRRSMPTRRSPAGR